MDKTKEIIKKELLAISQDRQSGSTEMLFNLLDTTEKIIASGFEITEFENELEQIITNQHLFTNLVNITKHIKSSLTSRYKITDFISSVKTYYNNLYERHAQNIIKNIDKPEITILTHSNSFTVKNVISIIQTTVRIKEIYQTISTPGNEGEIQAAFFANKGIRTYLIDDSYVAQFTEKADLIILGSDKYNNNFFVNKTGSLNICIIAHYYSKPVAVLSDKYKYEEKISLESSFYEKQKNLFTQHKILEIVPVSLCTLLV